MPKPPIKEDNTIGFHDNGRRTKRAVKPIIPTVSAKDVQVFRIEDTPDEIIQAMRQYLVQNLEK